MSSNRKKLTDRGAAPPKPSRKVALDEVLRTLQDLVQNELDVGSLSSRQADTPPSSDAVPPSVAASVPEDAAAETLASMPVADTIVLETPATPPEDITPSPASVAVTETTADGDSPAPSPRTPRRRASDRGVQQELPYLDTPAPSSKSVEMPPPAAPAAEPKDSDLPQFDAVAADWSAPPAELATTRDAELSIVKDELPSLSEASPPLVAEPHQPAAVAPETPPHVVAHETLHDIPVLEDAVDFHHEPSDAHLAGAAPADALLPTASAARRLAIQVAARLNVTLRKEGKPVLSSELIARLAHELETALAKNTSNMDNNGPEKP